MKGVTRDNPLMPKHMLDEVVKAAGEDAKKIAKEKILPKALDLAKSYLETGMWPVAERKSATPTLAEAIERAEALEERLEDKVKRHEDAKDLAKVVLNEALKVATKLALTAL